ncbi:MAG: tetratricopeptide repeat protein [Limisphaerales bacterium]
MATFNSTSAGHRFWKQAGSLPHATKFAATIFIFAAGMVFAGDTNSFAAKPESEFQRAQIQFQLNPKNSTNAWQFARACFDLADIAKTDKKRAAIANQGILACDQLIARDPKIAAAHYYLAMDLGELARTKFLGALKIVKEMESEFLTAVNLDARFDFAGPARNLGLLYREAPSFGSIGSRRKAREWLKRALQLAPDYPENHLNLIESYLKWGDRDAAKAELEALDSSWPAAQKKFTGEKWAQTWKDWTARRDAARKKLGKNSTLATSPKNGR